MSLRAAPSLRARLCGLVLAAVGLLWLAALGASYGRARHELDELLDAHLAQAAALLVAQSSDELDELARGHLPAADADKPRLVLQLWDGGRLRLHSADAPDARLSPRRQGFDTRRVGDVTWRVFSSVQGEDGLVLQLAEPVAQREHLARSVLWRLAWPLLLALPLIGLGVWLALGHGLRPLQRLAAAVAARAPLDATPLPELGAPREVLPLLQRLNALFARSAESLAREREFSGDASHELRTPIAAIRAQAQVAQGARDETERRTALAQVIAGCDRITHLIEQLLVLARLDAGATAASATSAVAPLLQEVFAELAPAAAARSIALHAAAGDAALRLPLPPDLLRSVLRNLVENAVRYGRDGGAVRVEAGAGDGSLFLSVCDDGPGIPAQQRAAARRRFHRLAGQERSGAGLGLALVERIAEVSGATLSLDDAPAGRGLCVRLRWPAPATRR